MAAMKPTIVTLTGYPDIFARLARSVAAHEPGARKIVVTSGEASSSLCSAAVRGGWQVVIGMEPFVFGRNANSGIDLAIGHSGTGVLLINDDCELTEPLCAPLAALARERPTAGVISPLVRGGVGNPLQHVGEWERQHPGALLAPPYFTSPVERLGFVCVWIPYETRATVGPFDERFTGYGGDDVDYCYRVRLAGLELGIATRCTVNHGVGHRLSSSFLRQMSPAQQGRDMRAMHKLFRAKHGFNDALARTIGGSRY